MTEFVAILTTSWRLIGAIREVVEQIEVDGRALQVHLALHLIGLLMLTS